MAESQVNFEVVLVGGSAGSIGVLMQILPELRNIPYALVLVLHRKSAEDETLEELIALKTDVPLCETEDKTKIKPGRLYVAPSNYHLLFESDGTVALDIAEKINHSRPSIDVSFESAAAAFGDRLTAILLSGANADGTEGLKIVRESGGKTVVQLPDTAEAPYMPESAIKHASPEKVLSVGEITALLRSF
jgi:two-component system chemotaxis response regulator CheB